jgi:hypothetical protein
VNPKIFRIEAVMTFGASHATPSVVPTGADERSKDDNDLEVLRLARKEWRISDKRVEDGESARLLGFIERLSRFRYEVQWVGDTPGWTYLRSFDLALAALARREEFDGTIQSGRLHGDSWAEPPLLPMNYRRQLADLRKNFSRQLERNTNHRSE